MIVATAAVLFAACLSIGLRSTSGGLDHWHPMDRLLLAMSLGGLMITAALVVSARFGLMQAGFGLACSLAPVGLFDLAKWWFQSRRSPTPWLIGAHAAPWILALRWTVVIAVLAGLALLALSRATLSPPQ